MRWVGEVLANDLVRVKLDKSVMKTLKEVGGKNEVNYD